MLSYIAQTTMEYLEGMPKKDRKKIGQFFTSKETAEYMASLFEIPDKEKITILDPGTGTGILSAALIDRILQTDSKICIELTCYETDENVLPVLKDNLQYMKNFYGNRLEIIIKREDYLLSQSKNFNGEIFSDNEMKKWDVIISNPPYKKIEKSIQLLWQCQK